MTDREIFALHAYGDAAWSDWVNTQRVMLNATNNASADSIAFTCHPEHRRAPHLDEYDHDNQGLA